VIKKKSQVESLFAKKNFPIRFYGDAERHKEEEWNPDEIIQDDSLRKVRRVEPGWDHSG
jgi:hypothetical protein